MYSLSLANESVLFGMCLLLIVSGLLGFPMTVFLFVFIKCMSVEQLARLILEIACSSHEVCEFYWLFGSI